jgi:trigger factor
MQVDMTREPNSEVRLTVTLSPEEVKQAIDATYQRLVGRVRVPGFRPGKAPRALLQRYVGADVFYGEATDEAVRRSYPQAIEQSGVVPLDEPVIDYDGRHVLEGEPFSYTVSLTARPEVNLPNYHEIRIPAPPVVVTEADVDEVIKELRESRATLQSVPGKTAEFGDVVTITITGRVEGREVLNRENADFELIEETDERRADPPGLSKELVGSRTGDIRESTLHLPPDYHNQELAGKMLSLRVLVKDVKRKVLPELTDEFVREISSYQTVAELREALRKNLEQERTQEAKDKIANEVIDSVIARTNLQVPEIMIAEEQDRLLNEQKRWFESRGLNFEQFLVAARRSEEEFRRELRPAAEKRVKRDLILHAIAQAERIEPPAEEVEAQMRQLAETSARSQRDYERLMRSERIRSAVIDTLSHRLALARLVEIASGVKLDDAAADQELAASPVEPEVTVEAGTP